MATTNPYTSLNQNASNTDSNSSGSGTTTTAGAGVTNTSSNTTNQTTGTRNTQTDNMTPESMAALELLIRQLMGGGTQAMAQDRANVLGEIKTNQAARAGYGKDDAFGDAQGAMAQQMRIALEKLLPSIVRSSEASGTSQSALRALLTQQAANQAAESSSALGLKAAVDYGQIATGFSNVIANLLQQKDPTAQLLINALNVAKGAVTNTQEQTTGTSNTQKQDTQTKVEAERKITTEQKSTDYAPFQIGPEEPAGKGIGSTQDFLSQLYGNNHFSGYTKI